MIVVVDDLLACYDGRERRARDPALHIEREHRAGHIEREHSAQRASIARATVSAERAQ